MDIKNLQRLSLSNYSIVLSVMDDWMISEFGKQLPTIEI